MSVVKRALCVTGLLFAMTADALAYGGPGAAITLIGSLIGVGLAVFASLFYVVAWPLRRLLKKRKGADTREAAGQTADTVAADTVAAAETATPPTQGQ